MHEHLLKLAELEREIRKVYLLGDEGITKFIVATIVANRMIQDDPIWAFIVAPPSGGKTEFISGLLKVRNIVPVSSLTPTTFISGQRPKNGEETSLLLRLDPTKGTPILTLKDFTTMLTINHDARMEIIGQMREIYDGDYTKIFGTGKTIRWKGKLGMIAGCTPSIYMAREMWSAMGERFIIYNLEQPERIEMALRGMGNASKIREQRAKIQQLFCEYIDSVLELPAISPEIPAELSQDIAKLSDMVTKARSSVERDWRTPNKEIIFVHPPEATPRFAMQLKTIASALLIINQSDKLDDMDRKILFKCALDTIQPIKRRCLQEIAKEGTISTSDFAAKLNYPTSSARRVLEELNAFEIVSRTKGGNSDQWTMQENYRELIKRLDPAFKVGVPLLPPELMTELKPAQQSLVDFVADEIDADIIWADNQQNDEIS